MQSKKQNHQDWCTVREKPYRLKLRNLLKLEESLQSHYLSIWYWFWADWNPTRCRSGKVSWVRVSVWVTCDMWEHTGLMRTTGTCKDRLKLACPSSPSIWAAWWFSKEALSFANKLHTLVSQAEEKLNQGCVGSLRSCINRNIIWQLNQLWGRGPEPGATNLQNMWEVTFPSHLPPTTWTLSFVANSKAEQCGKSDSGKYTVREPRQYKTTSAYFWNLTQPAFTTLTSWKETIEQSCCLLLWHNYLSSHQKKLI